MILHRGRFFLVLGLMFFALSGALPGQITTGTLRGSVTDAQGQVLPGVTIEITSEALMSPRSMTTDIRGNYRFLYLPPGHAKNWKKHCHRYNACGRPVYFVKSAEYEPGYKGKGKKDK